MDAKDLKSLRDRIKGIIFGAALGDAVGLATEFMTKSNASILYGNGPIKFGTDDGHEFWRDGHRRRWHENDFTDDTDQLLLILQCLLHSNGVLIPQHFAFRLKEWVTIGFPELSLKVACGVGLTVGSTLNHPEFLSNPHKASFDVWNQFDRNMAANGAVMRTSIIGVPFFWNEATVVNNAINCAKVTHADPRSIFSSVVVSVLISRILRSNLNSNPSGPAELKDSFISLMESGCIKDTNNLPDTVSILEPKEVPEASSSDQKAKSSLLTKMITTTKSLFLEKRPKSDSFPPNWPRHPEPDNSRLQNKSIIPTTPSIIDSFGTDSQMEQLVSSVIGDYRFLLTDSTVLSSSGKGVEWENDMEKYCNMSSKKLDDFKLDESKSIGYTYKCLGSALFCFTRSIPSAMTTGQFFRQVITDLTLEGGDSDTNCAVAGALLGARLGYSGLYKGWLKGLRHSDYIHVISDDLCDMVSSKLTAQM